MARSDVIMMMVGVAEAKDCKHLLYRFFAIGVDLVYLRSFLKHVRPVDSLKCIQRECR